MRLEELAGRSFNYEGVGGTQTGEQPDGYHSMTVSKRIGAGRAAFDRAADALMHWTVQQVAGIRLTASTERVAIGAESLGRLGLGPLGIAVPCRVVWLTEEPDRVGYAYGTLDGHPEHGEEAFVLALENESVVFTIRAFSRPATWYTRLGGPVTRVLQRYIATRYAARLQSLSA
jgi:uncharacterized protein (UPF0548 family)